MTAFALESSRSVTTSRILVTGATGFVGRALVRRLLADGRAVRAAVRPASEALPAGAETVTVDDIGPDTDWRTALAGVDAVVHLAARAHVLRDSSADAHARYRAVNTLGALRLAEAAAAAGIRRFVFLSSARVHGDHTTGSPFNESSPLLAEDPYGRSKADAERGLAALGTTGRLEPVILRPPLVYGPGARGNFARLVALVARGVPLPLGTVRNRRSLIFVGNLVDAIVRSLDHPSAAGETFMVSDREDLSTPDLVRRIARALGKPARLVPVPAALLRLGGALAGRSDDVARLLDDLVVDSSKIRAFLGWSPVLTLDEGLAQTAAWYRTVADHSHGDRSSSEHGSL
jgi:nucleoside-diphosphate-sugar epimerase